MFSFSNFYRRVFFAYSMFLVVVPNTMFLPTLIAHQLPVNVALPFSTENSKKKFLMAYAYELVGAVLAACVLICVDNLFVGFLLLIRHQQEILKYRLKNISWNLNSNRTRNTIIIQHRSIKQCINSHNRIYR